MLKVLTVILVAGAMAMAFAHALELPGKMRLGRHEYFVVQRIYYPGFTIGGGIAEVGGIVATFALTLMSSGAVQFRLIAGALAALLGMQLVFWFMTQPINKHWLQEVELTAPAKRFFATEGSDGTTLPPKEEWKALRDRWELSHVLRAGFAMLSLILLTTAIAIESS
ncbi:anthrone oxygenase family protein [Mesorhizobium sp. ORS 3428]|uniref:anthrone oxygenase family protein n=1 Tax=Mesorhizobium sp. ORS 3428 TaxID=540997 RepID=UPI003FCE76BE